MKTILIEGNERNGSPGVSPHQFPLWKSWKETIRAMERECAKAWLESARYWRAEAKRHLDAGKTAQAAEALLNAVIRETYAAEDMAKSQGLTSERVEELKSADAELVNSQLQNSTTLN